MFSSDHSVSCLLYVSNDISFIHDGTLAGFVIFVNLVTPASVVVLLGSETYMSAFRVVNCFAIFLSIAFVLASVSFLRPLSSMPS